MTPQELRLWRIVHGLTQDQAALTLGCSTSAYRSYETGRQRLPRWLALKFQLMALMKDRT